ncbi:hypothetical protein ACC687_40245, partial [Rhizobium ruizarguesonis]
FVIGTGPVNPEQMTPEALAAVDAATDFFVYGPYLYRLQLRHDQLRHASDNLEELGRAGAALAMAKTPGSPPETTQTWAPSAAMA